MIKLLVSLLLVCLPLQAREVKAVVVDVHDGDTVKVAMDIWYDLTLTDSVRVYGIDSPELWTPEGKIAQKFASSSITNGATVTLVFDDKNPKEKYGRYMARVLFNSPTGQVDLSEFMIQNKQAKPYFGGKR